MKIYMAGPFFNEREIAKMKKMIEVVKNKYPEAELFIPMEHKIKNGEELPNPVWAKKVFDMDVKAIDESDFVVAMYLGHYSDTGTVWEQGYAYGKGVPVILYVPESMKDDVSLMVMNSCLGIIREEDYTLEKFNQK